MFARGLRCCGPRGEATHYGMSQVAYHAVGICGRKGCKDSRLILALTEVVDHIAGKSTQSLGELRTVIS